MPTGNWRAVYPPASSCSSHNGPGKLASWVLLANIWCWTKGKWSWWVGVHQVKVRNDIREALIVRDTFNSVGYSEKRREQLVELFYGVGVRPVPAATSQPGEPLQHPRVRILAIPHGKY